MRVGERDGQVVGTRQSGVHTFGSDRGVHVGGIHSQHDAPTAEYEDHPVPRLVGGEPVRVTPAHSERRTDRRAPPPRLFLHHGPSAAAP